MAVETLQQVRAAIELERRVQRRTLDVRVDEVTVEDAEHGLWRLRVALPPMGRLQRWEGAWIWKGLDHTGVPWKADVVAADLRQKVLVVAGNDDAPPQEGRAVVQPFDFLAAPHALLAEPRFGTVRVDYARLLGLATGALVAAEGTLSPLAAWDGPLAWTYGWAMVWGPPGTGKTHTTVTEVGRLLARPGTRVLVLATTNRATDELALRLGAALPRGTVQRLGWADPRPFLKEDLACVLPLEAGVLQGIAEASERADKARSAGQRARAQRVLARLRRGARTLGDVLVDDTPRCVVTTLFAALRTLVSDSMEPFHGHTQAPFTTVVLDEAGLVPRATAAAAGLLAARQVVLVGDPKQLSPICVAARSMDEGVRRWLSRSAMEHADETQPHTQALREQRRMHPDIGEAVSTFQYGGLVRNHPSVKARALPAALAGLAGWPAAAWVVVDACDGMDAAQAAPDRPPGGRSWWRPGGLKMLELLLDATPALRRTKGLYISPYRAQAEAAGRLFAARSDCAGWRASTVHAQQGAEADVVVFDLVRHGGWQIAEEKRLITVALSRARHRLLVFAATAELQQPEFATLASSLTPVIVRAGGRLKRRDDPSAQQGLFGARSAMEPGPPSGRSERLAAEPSPPPWAGRADSLGMQIRQSRAARSSLTRPQARLVRRQLSDLGPRVVRGVAGSGKTIVLARWAALELARYPDRTATIVYGNLALRPHLHNLLGQAWRVSDGPAQQEPPWDRIDLRYAPDLLRALHSRTGKPAPQDRYDLSALASDLLAAKLPPCFDLLYIDEAQDLGHEALHALSMLVRPDPSEPSHRPVRFFYDNAQNVYGQTTPRWSEFGLDMRGRSTVLRESFRSTRPAMELALDVVDALEPLQAKPDFAELIAPRTGPPVLVWTERGWRADFCVAQGQVPEVALHDSRADELAALVARVRRWLEGGVVPADIRVLAPTHRRCEAAARALLDAGLRAEFQRSKSLDHRAPLVVVTTPQSFKGYQAELVAVVGLDGFVNRAGELLTPALYVALTRARTWSWVSATRVNETAPSRAIVDALEQAVARRPERRAR